MKKLLSDLSLEQMAEVCKNQPKYRIKQLFRWVQRGNDYGTMSDIPLQFREELSAEYDAVGVEIHKHITAKDGTTKLLFRLRDGNIIEGVLMKYKYGNTLCVSTQVGCRMNCAFCASGLDGLIRNLSAGEILGQVISVNTMLGGSLDKREVTNIVLMGSGEPLDNYNNVASFLRLVCCADGLNISQRNISLSTCGLADKMRLLADDGFSVTLTISLHSAIQDKREQLIPAAKSFKLADIMSASRYYFEKTGRRVVFEYALVGGRNHSDEDARALASLLKGFPTHVNLIMLNPVAEKGLSSASRKQAQDFLAALTALNVSATIRRVMGTEISGACGQLRRKFVGCSGTTYSGQKD